MFHARGVRGSGRGDRSEGMLPGLGAENLLDRQGGCPMLVLFFAVHILCAVRWN